MLEARQRCFQGRSDIPLTARVFCHVICFKFNLVFNKLGFRFNIYSFGNFIPEQEFVFKFKALNLQVVCIIQYYNINASMIILGSSRALEQLNACNQETFLIIMFLDILYKLTGN